MRLPGHLIPWGFPLCSSLKNICLHRDHSLSLGFYCVRIACLIRVKVRIFRKPASVIGRPYVCRGSGWTAMPGQTLTRQTYGRRTTPRLPAWPEFGWIGLSDVDLALFRVLVRLSGRGFSASSVISVCGLVSSIIFII